MTAVTNRRTGRREQRTEERGKGEKVTYTQREGERERSERKRERHCHLLENTEAARLHDGYTE